MPTTKAGQRAVNKYMKNNYDRVNLVLSKGKKEELQVHAQEMGESLNAFINRAINQAVERDKATRATPTDTDPVSEGETEK